MTRELRAARIATFAYFGLNGCALGTWVVHIPAIEQRTAVSHAVLGWLLLLLGLGAFAGMQISGPLTDRLGPRRVVPAGATLCAGALILPALATNTWSLGLALLVLGLGNGTLDVSMNAHAVQVETEYQRPIMSTFHAVFSIGGLLASILSATTLNWGWTVTTTLPLVAALALSAGIVAAPALLSRPTNTTTTNTTTTNTTGTNGTGTNGRSRSVRTRIWALAGLAFLLMLCEGIANDWSALSTREALKVSASTAALAYGGFAAAMTVGRLLTDRIVTRIGPVSLVRYGTALAAGSLVLVALAPTVALAVTGWTLFGIGLSGTIPQLFSAAGHAEPAAAGRNVSLVAGLGYLGMLAGPAIIGPMTRLVPLSHTFFLPAGLCVITALFAGIVRTVTHRGPGLLDQKGETPGSPRLGGPPKICSATER